MTNDLAAFKKIQYEFTAHLRDPENKAAPPDIEDRRMEIYRGLLYRNVESFISNAYPVVKKLYSDEDWHKMVRDFFITHQSKSPYFRDISKEFLDYLVHERQTQPEDPIFLAQLAHYEWVEIDLTFTDREIDMNEIDPMGDVLENIPILSPLAKLHNYDYPVHQIKPSFQPQEASETPTFLLVYRNKQDKVGFMELNPISAMLAGLLEKKLEKTGKQLLKDIINEINHPNPDLVLKGGEQTLKQLRSNDIILGTRSL